MTGNEKPLEPALQLYLDLLKKVLLGLVYRDGSIGFDVQTREELTLRMQSEAEEWPEAAHAAIDVKTHEEFDLRARSEGQDWPEIAHTMVGVKRLDNVQACAEQVLADGVPGDFIETGVWRGGVCIFLRGLLRAHGCTDRNIWVADSFEGLPLPSEHSHHLDRVDLIQHCNDILAVSLPVVEENFRRYGLLDHQVRFLPGWFKDTLPDAPIEQLAILRLDGDLYESTMDVLVNLYSKVSPGGFVIIDDYALPSCRKAVDDFRADHAVTDPITTIDWSGVYWRRTT